MSPRRRQPTATGRRSPDPGVDPRVWTDALCGVLLGGVLLAGLARPGFPLLRDMVSTPRPPLSDAALGIGSAAARAAPQDLVMVASDRALAVLGAPTWPVLGVLCLAFCVWAAVAAGALVRTVWAEAGFAVRGPAVVLALWNPWVVERLLQGHWSLLAALAAVLTMPVLFARRRVRWPVVGACVAAAGLTPTGWLLAVLAGLGSALPGDGRGRRASVLLVVALTAAAPWAVATVLGGDPSTPAATGTGVSAFAARAEPGLGTLGSLVALGGIWNAQAVPPSRSTWWAVVAGCVLVALWSVAARELWRRGRDPRVTVLLAQAVVVWGLVAAAATGPGLALLDALVRAVPAAGVLRDTQKFVVLALPATVLAAAAAVRELAAHSPRRRPPGRAGSGGGAVRTMVASTAVALAAVAAVPDAPLALWRSLAPVDYGPGWRRVDEIVRDSPGGGDLLVLPAGSFRSTPLWAGGRPVLDPAPRMLGVRVLVTGDLVVGDGRGSGHAAPGEDSRARAAERALLSGAPPEVLTGLGVRWVLDERTSLGPRGGAEATVTGVMPRYQDEELTLYELSGPVAVRPPAPPWRRVVAVVAHIVWALLLLSGLVALAGRRRGLPPRSR